MFKKHFYRVGSNTLSLDDIPQELDKFEEVARKQIEPWLSAVFQAEHLNLLIGSGFSSAVAFKAGATPAGMARVALGSTYDTQIDTHAAASAARMGRGTANIEDQLRSALAVVEGLSVTDPTAAVTLSHLIAQEMKKLLSSLLVAEQGIKTPADPQRKYETETALQSFLLSFASRSASRERLHIFTTNYDRVIEHGCDLAGIRTIDRFVGALNPVFRSSRVDVDMHYNPPGIRGEPRFMEGVVRLTKLHGSLDWHFAKDERRITKVGIPFGAPIAHTDMAVDPVDTVMIYPNPAKDVETTQYPYAELFRDFASSLCRPNAVLVTYGYGFGDDHINRVILDMLTIPSTHLVIISYDLDDRVKTFCEKVLPAQVSILGGPHFGDLTNLVHNYLPKPALDFITGRMTAILRNRPDPVNGLTEPDPPENPVTPEIETPTQVVAEDDDEDPMK